MNSITSHRPTVFAAWFLIGIAVLHSVATAVHPYWGEWLSGSLRGSSVDSMSLAFFWTFPGSFVVPLVLLGLVLVRMGRRGEPAPRYVGWMLGLWCVGCLALVGLSGFMFVLVPAAVLIIAGFRRSARREPSDEREAAGVR